MTHYQSEKYQNLLAEIAEIQTAINKSTKLERFKSYLDQANRLKEAKREATKSYISSRGL